VRADPPRKMVIETTQACVLHCCYCPTGLGLIHRPDLMPWELFTKLADEIEGFVRHVYIEFMGEPALHPRIGDMIRRVKEFATVDIATNGVLVTKEVAEAFAPCDVISVTICGLREPCGGCATS
jgi:MoaA/NifB/PqqE/SkfB family radical SAM enzyme